MASLPGGTFKMGDRGDTVVEEGEHGEITDTCEVLWATNRARDPDAPRLFCTGGDTVTVQPFCLDVQEVTVDAYASCVRQGRCSAEHLGYSGADTAGLTTAKACNYGQDSKGNHPINCVDWVQASSYCRAQDERLPTEEEWEWAARGGASVNKYPWGNAAPEKQLCWSGPRGLLTKRAGTCPVGSFPSGDAPGGIHDLAGNVWEWTSSSYDPSGPSPNSRVFRGGAWNGDDVPNFRAAACFYGGASTWRSFFVGFRCAL
jgi:formylglycine-generating enzyme required for sulfatase activity